MRSCAGSVALAEQQAALQFGKRLRRKARRVGALTDLVAQDHGLCRDELGKG